MEEPKKFINLLVYRKALEIFRVSRAIACSLSESKNILEMENSSEIRHRFAGELVVQALRLPPQLAQVYHSASEESKIRGAKRINKVSQKLLAKCKKLELYEKRDIEFLDLLKAEIVSFENLFSDWFYTHQLNKNN